MAISTRTRFEILKRDRFTCAYCGRTPPAVLLEVDHVLPRAAGGTDEPENLITSCWDCNRGKAANLLEEGSAPTVTRAAVDDLSERVAQARAYAELNQQWRELEDKMLDEVNAAWAEAFGALTVETSEGSHWKLLHAWEKWPAEGTLREILGKLPLADVLAAIEIAARWVERDFGDRRSYDRTCAYFYGVCRRLIRDRNVDG